ncbi:hypothetical protein [Thiolapillus sp.]
MKQRGMIRYLHMGCGESLAARQLENVFLQDVGDIKPVRPEKSHAEKKRRETHEEQR